MLIRRQPTHSTSRDARQTTDPGAPPTRTATPWTRHARRVEALSATCLATALWAVAPPACDSAHDGAFAGEPLFTFEGRVSGPIATEPLLDGSRGTLRLALAWDDAVDPLASDAVSAATGAPQRFAVGIHVPPADAHLRPAASGRFALGELFVYADGDDDHRPSGDATTIDPIVGVSRWLVLWTPEGAAGAPLATAFDAGFHLVRASAPCDVAPLTIIATPAGELPNIRLDATPRERVRFAADDCLEVAAAWSPDRLSCPPFAAARWLCRFGTSADPDMCARCGEALFPEGASGDTCLAWQARCVDSGGLGFEDADPLECAAEARVCLVGEAPSRSPCDLTCACDAAYARCLERLHDETVCASKRAGCVWTDDTR